MSATPAAIAGSIPVAAKDKSGSGKWFMVFAIVVGAGILSSFYAVNDYASGTGAIVKSANNNSARFEAIFRDLTQARYRTLNIAAETMLQSRVTVEAFAKADRAALVARFEPFFATLKKDHGIDQLNFWTPPAKVFYRAGKPEEFGMDLSTFRKSIVTANGMATITWTSTAGSTYTVQGKTNSQDPTWINLPGDVTATGSTTTKQDAVSGNTQRFYRVITQ